MRALSLAVLKVLRLDEVDAGACPLLGERICVIDVHVDGSTAHPLEIDAGPCEMNRQLVAVSKRIPLVVMRGTEAPPEVQFVFVGGIEVHDSDLLKLAHLLRKAGFDHNAFHIERSLDAFARDLLPAIHEREEILRVLDDPPTIALAELRAVLVQENVGRVARGSSSCLGVGSTGFGYRSY